MKESQIFKYLVSYANGHEAVLWVVIDFEPKESSMESLMERSQRVIDCDKAYPHAMTNSFCVATLPFKKGDEAALGFVLYEKE